MTRPEARDVVAAIVNLLVDDEVDVAQRLVVGAGIDLPAALDEAAPELFARFLVTGDWSRAGAVAAIALGGGIVTEDA